MTTKKPSTELTPHQQEIKAYELTVSNQATEIEQLKEGVLFQETALAANDEVIKNLKKELLERGKTIDSKQNTIDFATEKIANFKSDNQQLNRENTDLNAALQLVREAKDRVAMRFLKYFIGSVIVILILSVSLAIQLF